VRFLHARMVMSAIDLVKDFPNPTEEQIREQLDGNCAAAPAITNRQGDQSRFTDDEELTMGATPYIGASIKAKRTTAFSQARATTPTTSRCRGRPMRISCARPTPREKSKSIKKDKALKGPGVVAIFTGDDLAGQGQRLPCGWLITDVNGQPMKEPRTPASRRARHAMSATTSPW